MSTETNSNLFVPPITFQERFDNSRNYWQQAIKEERAVRTQFFDQVFESEESVIYREIADDEMLMLIARTLNETWVGIAKCYGRVYGANQ
jgi:hypothetical protein